MNIASDTTELVAGFRKMPTIDQSDGRGNKGQDSDIH